MIRRVYPWLVVLAVVAVGMLASCNGGRTETPSAPPTQPPLAQSPVPSPTETSVSPTQTSPPVLSPPPAPTADGAILLRERCATCHALDRVESARKTAEEWERTVVRMIGRGARLTEAERAVLVEYLATHYR